MLRDRVQISYCSLYCILLFLLSLCEIAGPVFIVQYLFNILSSLSFSKLNISFVEYVSDALKIKFNLMWLFYNIIAKSLNLLTITIHNIKLLDILLNLTNREFSFDICMSLNKLQSLKLTFYSECAKLLDALLISFIQSVMSIY